MLTSAWFEAPRFLPSIAVPIFPDQGLAPRVALSTTSLSRIYTRFRTSSLLSSKTRAE